MPKEEEASIHMTVFKTVNSFQVLYQNPIVLVVDIVCLLCSKLNIELDYQKFFIVDLRIRKCLLQFLPFTKFHNHKHNQYGSNE